VGIVMALIITADYPSTVHADEPVHVEASSDTTQLNLPDQVELSVLISLVSEQLGLQIVFDDKLGSQRISIKTPREVPTSSLRGILESALQINGLALVEDDQPGWLRIVVANDLTRLSGPPRIGLTDAIKPGTAVTQVFELMHADPQKVDSVVKSFLTTPGGNSFVVQDHGLLVVTDYASNFERISATVDLLDRPGREVEVRFIPIQHMAAGEAAQELKSIRSARLSAQGQTAQRDTVQIMDQARTNRLVLIGPPEAMAEIEGLVGMIDVPLGLETRSYRLATASVTRVDNLAKNLLGETGTSQRYRSIIDEEAGLLIVTATPDAHVQVESLAADLDSELADSEPVMRFYKLANATAAEVLATISEIEGVGGIRVGSTADRDDELLPVPAENNPQASGESTDSGASGGGGSLFAARSLSIETDRSNVVVDPNTNTLIVMAEPAVQKVYQELIERLDRRRPQVLIEVTLVSLDTSGGFSLGVEYSRSDESGKANTLTFSSFGLSEVDKATGSLDLIPGLGFNGTVISADIADVVVRALSNNGRAKVISAPRILVNDNATGNLTSASDAPFTSVNASSTVSTTSFGGFESAGTTIDVTPHISEGDHLSLEYSVTLSSFGEGGSEGVPPPRQRSELSSEVTVPDGNTIIVGGLNSSNYSETIQKIPLLGDIPGLEYLFSSRSNNTAESTLFVFIRPVILRDDLFQDLKFLSKTAMQQAELPSNDPESLPLMIY
jgi:general secretion pathway protein D